MPCSTPQWARCASKLHLPQYTLSRDTTQNGEPSMLACTTAGGPRYHCAEMSAMLRTSPTGRNGPENLSTTEGRAHASVTRRCAGAPGGGGRMPSAPMTAQRQRTIGFWLVRFPCCGQRFPNQTQAGRHLVQADGYDPTAAAQDVTRVVRADRTRA